MLGDAVPFLRCPHCGEGLALDGELRCPNGHAFDVARQGYVSLLAGEAGAGTGDTPEMVAAREAFLAGGHFDGLAERVAEAGAGALGEVPGCVVDVGAGSAHYLSLLLDRGPGRVGVALDLSKPALRRAARAHPRIGAVACDVWSGIPVRSGSAALVLDVFSPRNPAEIDRILHPQGALLVATPTRRHLAELIDALDLLTVDPDKDDRLADQLSAFRLEAEELWETTMSLDRLAAVDLVAMGPSAHRPAADLANRLEALPDPMPVTASVRVAIYRR